MCSINCWKNVQHEHIANKSLGKNRGIFLMIPSAVLRWDYQVKQGWEFSMNCFWVEKWIKKFTVLSWQKRLMIPRVCAAWINKSKNNYPPSCTIIVQVHERSCIPLLLLLGINKCLSELDGMVHVVTTATPVKGPFGIMWWAFFSRIAGARVQLALTAGSGQCVDHACWGDGIHKGSLTTVWKYTPDVMWNTELQVSMHKNLYKMQKDLVHSINWQIWLFDKHRLRLNSIKAYRWTLWYVCLFSVFRLSKSKRSGCGFGVRVIFVCMWEEWWKK